MLLPRMYQWQVSGVPHADSAHLAVTHPAPHTAWLERFNVSPCTPLAWLPVVPTCILTCPALRRDSTLALTAWRPHVRDCTRLATWHDRVTVLFADIQGAQQTACAAGVGTHRLSHVR